MSFSHSEMSATNETTSTIASRSGMDVDTAVQHITVVSEEVLQESETAAVAESISNNDESSVAADVVSEPEFTLVSSGTSSSSQGL